MSRMSSNPPMRVKCCWGPCARALVVALTLGHLRVAEALPLVARTSPSRASAGLPRVASFMGGRKASSRFAKLGTVDAYETKDAVKMLLKMCSELALPDQYRAIARVFFLREVPPLNQCTGTLYSSACRGPWGDRDPLPLAVSPVPFLIFPQYSTRNVPIRSERR
jgi:hypothetical protein